MNKKTISIVIALMSTIICLVSAVIMSVNNISRAEDAANCYVSSLRILTVQDGGIAADLDENDEVGNDSSQSNDKVRTFDYVNYTLNYTTDLIDKREMVDSAQLGVIFTLDVDPKKATFTDDSLNWMTGKKITYYYEDGTNSTTWDQSKTVTKQVLTGIRTLENSEDNNMIPGTGQLSVAVYVKAAKNGDTFTPSFSANIIGSDESYRKSAMANTLTCTCFPHYNVSLMNAGYDGQLVYFDDDGSLDSKGLAKSYMTDPGEGSNKGRMYQYGLVVSLYNTGNRGLCGIEIPSGDITLDIDTSFTMKANGVATDLKEEDGYRAYLWDYNVSTGSNTKKTGKLGRLMYHYSNSGTTYPVYAAPGYKTPNTENGEYNGGDISITVDDADSYLYHVTLSGYEFDWEDFTFPKRNLGDSTSTIRYGTNVGAFTAAHLQFAVTFPREDAITADAYFTATEQNISATSISGTTVTEEEYHGDDSRTEQVYLNPLSGSFDKYIYFCSTFTGGKPNSTWNAGDSYALPGSQTRFYTALTYSGEKSIQAYNQLVKIDDNCLSLIDTAKIYDAVSTSNPISTPGTIYAMYAAKPDQTGWTDEAEMYATREENLIYFKSLADLTAAGYTCVGVLYEVRDAALFNNSSIQLIYTKANVKKTVEIGDVYAITNDTRAWFTQSSTADLWENIVYDSSIGAYGLGDTTWNVGDSKSGWHYFFYSNDKGNMPSYQDYTTYTKTAYDKGTKVANTHYPHGCYSGDSLLIVGAKNGITVDITDIGDDGYKRTSYDMDRGQRTVTYKIKPTLTAVSSSSAIEDVGSTTMYATVTLPYDLTYVTGSSSSNNITVVKNDDGTSTLTWSIPGCEVGKAIDPISFSCLIGHAGEADDVQNADNVKITAQVTSSFDYRSCTTSNGNLDTETFNVIRLAATAISKKTDKALMDLGDENTWELKYGNSADIGVRDTKIYDVLPYSGDANGSSFTGSYKVTKIVLNLASAPTMYSDLKSDYKFKYTEDKTIRTATPTEVIDEQTFTAWTESDTGVADDTNKTITFDNLDMSSLAVYGLWFDLGQLYGHEYLTIDVTCSYADSTGGFVDEDGKVQKAGDCYRNLFYEYANPLDQSAIVTSNAVATKVVQRDLGGVVWYDSNSNSIQNDTETKTSGETVTLYRKTASSYGNGTTTVNLGGMDTVLYDAYNVYGTKLGSVTTDNAGSYLYEMLESGDYVVVFNGYDEYGASQMDIGGDDFKDSDAKVTIADNKLVNAYIEITMPESKDMSTPHYESLNNDLGLIEYKGDVTVKKTDENGEKLFGAVFTLDGDSSQTLTVNGSATISDLALGSYTLKETTAPTNYNLDTTEYAITVAQNAEYTTGGNGNFKAKVTINGTVTNALTVIDKTVRTKATVTKVWDDDNDRDRKRQQLTFVLKGSVNGKSISSVEKTATMALGTTSLVFDDLPVMYGSQAISYTVEESALDGYETTVGGTTGTIDDGYVITVTNVHKIATISIPVTKIWSDNDDQDKKRPTTLKIALSGTDGSTREETLTAADEWKHTFENLPVYSNGKKITYTIDEEEVDGYMKNISGAPETGYIITNSHTVLTIDVTATKIWDDASDSDGKRPPSIEFELYADGVLLQTKSISGTGNTWTCTFEKLNAYKDGKKIEYTVKEKTSISGYTTVQDGLTITNSYEPKTTTRTVTKVWNDNDNQDGIRPASITVTLTGNDGKAYSQILNEGNKWTYTFENLPMYYNGGKEVQYTASENTVNGYTTEKQADGSTLTITNTHTPITTSITIKKVWNDSDDQDGKRSKNISYTVKGNGKEYTGSLTENGDWTDTIENVPVFYNGSQIAYTVAEDEDIDGYVSAIESSGDYTSGYVFTLTNTHTAATTNITVQKKWDDADDQDGKRPDQLTFNVTGDNGYTNTITINAGGEWKRTLNDLPAYNAGKIVSYTVEEQVPDEYTETHTFSGSWSEGYKWEFTNSHTPEIKDITVNKIWRDNDDRHHLRPTTISVTLHSDNKTYDMTISESSSWQGTFKGVPVYEKGKKIDYTITEAEVAGYQNEISKDDDKFTVTNSLLPETISLSIVKRWNDDNNIDKLRQTITFTLFADGIAVREIMLDGSKKDSDGNWITTIVDLPKYVDDKEITYTISENDVPGYTSTIERVSDCFTVTNTHIRDYSSAATDNNENTDAKLASTSDKKVYVIIVIATFSMCVLTFMRIRRKI